MPPLLSEIAQGECTAPIESAGVNVRIVHYRPAVAFTMHAHQTSSLAMVIRGGFEEESPSAVFAARAGDCVIKPARARHANRFGAETTTTIQLEIVDPGAVGDLEPALAGNRLPEAFPSDNPAFTAAMFELFSVIRAPIDPANRAAIRNAVIEALGAATAMLSRRRVSSPYWLERAMRELCDRCAAPFNVEAFAAEFSVHPVHLARVFRQSLGCGVVAFVRRHRIRRAAECVARTPRPLSEIALECGFYDQAHLTRAFRREFGVTPGAYRELTKN